MLSMSRSLQRSRRGFTLIELLVVIAIIAILAAILFPVFSMARESAKRSKCLSNLRQISTAIQLYKDNWAGSFPSAGKGEYPAPPLYSAYPYSFWAIMIQPYHKAKDLTRCQGALMTPDDRYAYPTPKNSEITKRTIAFNYGINECMLYADWGPWTKESSLPQPSKTLLIADSSWVLINSWYDTTGPDGVRLPHGMIRMKYANSPTKTWSSNWVGDPSQMATRHGGVIQVLFADGHVRSIAGNALAYKGDYNVPSPDKISSTNQEFPLIHPGAQLLK